MPDDPEQELDAEGIPVLQDTVTADGSEAVPPPSDRPHSIEEESLRDRVKQELPEGTGPGRPRVGQLVEPGAEDGWYDDEPTAVGALIDDPDVALSAEEAAIHIVDETST
jgi:hypothetical protein